MSNALVAFFSATGVTAGLAMRLAHGLGCDYYEIKPLQPYTKADLNWMNPLSRSTKEMNRKKYRPALAGPDAPVANCDTLFLGFPIWRYVAPTIINSFLEAYDFAGKRIILFATSGGSGFGKTLSRLTESCPGAQLVEGRVFHPDTSEEELAQWAQSLIK